MASFVSRTTNCIFRSRGIASTRNSVAFARYVSTTSNKKAEVDVGTERGTQQQTSLPHLQNYKSAADNAGEYSFKVQDASGRGTPLDDALRKAADPLQHILNHESASIILRDACKCSKCKDKLTSQRDFNLAHIPADLKPSSIEQDARGNLVIQWQNDMLGWENHVSVFTPHEIERLRTYMQKEHQTSACLWNRTEFEKNKFTVTYNDYMNSEEALAEVLHNFARYGVVFIDGVPEDPESVCRIANRIALIKSTFYGETWDIKSVPNPTNVAFTNKHLGFHGDLMYLKEPPTVQYLHCLHNSCPGGESRFVDQFKALDTLYSEDPELADVLTRTKLRYEYENDGFYYSDIKPIVQWRTDSYAFPRRAIRGAINDQLNSVYRMSWGPQFLGSILSDFGMSQTDLTRSIAAMKKYADILDREELVYQEKMIPGRCVMFDNLRCLHARNEFDVNSGKRWLRGTYVDAQDLWSLEMKMKNYMSRLELESNEVD